MGADGEHETLYDCIVELKGQRDKATRARNEVLDRVAGIQLFADNMKKAEEMQRALIEKAAKWALSMHYHTPEKTP
jgi:hypothetical protein